MGKKRIVFVVAGLLLLGGGLFKAGQGFMTGQCAWAASVDSFIDETISNMTADGGLDVDSFRKSLKLPTEYNVQPNDATPTEQRDDIIRIHKRYWENFQKIKNLSLNFSLHTYDLNDNSKPGTWDMDVSIGISGTNMSVNGQNENKVPITANVSENEIKSSEARSRNWGSLLTEIVQINYANPEFCKNFSSLRKNVPLTTDGIITYYDVLISKRKYAVAFSDPQKSYPSEWIEYPVEYWFNQNTGMLESVISCNPVVKERFGKYDKESWKYNKMGDVYFPLEYIRISQLNNRKMVERFSNIAIQTKP